MSQQNPLDFGRDESSRRRAKPSVARGLKRAAQSAGKDIGRALSGEFAKLLTPQTIVTGIAVVGGMAAVLLFLLYLDATTELVPLEKLPAQERRATWLLIGVFAASFVAGGSVWLATIILPSDELQQKATGLGNVIGRSREEVFNALGNPQQTEHGEVTAYTWATPKYAITFGFQDGLCTGVLREVNF